MARFNLPLTFKDLAKSTTQDESLQMVMNFVSNSWPKTLKDPLDTKKFSMAIKDPIGQNSSCLCLGCRNSRLSAPTIPKIVMQFINSVPFFPSKQSEISPTTSPSGTPGIRRMKQLARSYCYWPKWNPKLKKWSRNARLVPSLPNCQRRLSYNHGLSQQSRGKEYTLILLDPSTINLSSLWSTATPSIRKSSKCNQLLPKQSSAS
uniref:Integrase zinc-binding domain-containing protein n=1 Tax=Ditylenchus dipsaci TaxID=166011 RepID=A0A915DN04_9BILA